MPSKTLVANFVMAPLPCPLRMSDLIIRPARSAANLLRRSSAIFKYSTDAFADFVSMAKSLQTRHCQ